MDPEHALRGACACGRNRYIVEVPRGSTQLAEVLFDTTRMTRTCTPILQLPRTPSTPIDQFKTRCVHDMTHTPNCH